MSSDQPRSCNPGENDEECPSFGCLAREREVESTRSVLDPPSLTIS